MRCSKTAAFPSKFLYFKACLARILRRTSYREIKHFKNRAFFGIFLMAKGSTFRYRYAIKMLYHIVDV